MKRKARVIGLFLGLIGLLGEVSLNATQLATLVGGVYDQAGAPVPGAKVYLKNPLAGFAQAQTSNADGEYTFNNVPATNAEEGEYYLLSVEKAGFATSEERHITVNVGDVRRVLPPFNLTPLAAATAAPAPSPSEPAPSAPVQPTTPQPTRSQPASAPPPVPHPPSIQPSVPLPRTVVRVKAVVTKSEGPTVPVEVISNTLGGVIDSQTVRTLPLRGRDFLDLALLAPGTYPVEQGSILEGASLVVNGMRANMSNFLLDGADNNDYTINQSLPFQIVEAMQEFRVQASTSPAEFGRSGGAQVNSISRRGLNTVHGAAFEFLRNSRLSAENFFSAYNGGTFDQYVRERRLLGVADPLADPTLAALYNRRKPQVIQNQFGANLGGALEKDKLFGFFNWESFRVSNPRPIFEGVPPSVLRSNPACSALFGIGTCDPVALALYNLYPTPNVPRTGSFNPVIKTFTTDPDFGPAYFVGESANRTASDNLLERIDWRESEQSSMSFKHNLQRIDQIQGGTIPRTALYPGNGTEVNGRNQNLSYNYVQQLTPYSGNELRLGWNRFRLATMALDRSIDPGTLGLKMLNFSDRGLPTIVVGAPSKILIGEAPFTRMGADLSVPSTRANNVWSVADTLSHSRGRHNTKIGAEFRYIRLDVRNEAFGRGILGFFTGSFVAAGSSSLPPGLPDVASIARVDPAFGGGFDRSLRTHSIDGFVQDQWRLRPNLSLSYGVRYEANTAPVESRDRLVNFYPALNGLVRAGSKTIFDAFGNITGTASASVPRGGFETDKNNWGPRVGFAWDPWKKGKTVVRGGYAVMFDQEPLEPSVNMLLNPPFVLQDFSFFPVFTLEDTFGVPSATSTWFRFPYSITARDPGTRTPYMHQFNFGVQQQVGGEALLELAYIGSAGHKLPRLRDTSACTQDLIISDPSACFAFSNGAFTNLNLFPNIVNQENSANSNFHSVLARVEVRARRGFHLGAHYQFAKSIDGASSSLPQVFILSPPNASLLTSLSFLNPEELAAANNISPTLSLRPTLPVVTTRPRLPQDSNNLRAERARSDFDVKHRAVLNFTYDIPGWERLRAVGKGWQVAAIETVQSGQPYTVFVDFFGIPFRPNLLSRPVTYNGNPDAAISPAVPVGFAGSTAGAFGINFNHSADPSMRALLPGNLGRNSFRGAEFANLDFSIVKNTYLGQGERKHIQFRAEFFNLFNTPNFLEPYSRAGLAFDDVFGTFVRGGGGVSVFDPFFGKILQARPAREIQFAIKLNF